MLLDAGYSEWLEKNTHILYPALAVVALVAIVVGILSAWRTDELKGSEKYELKREIILALRQRLHGASGDELARASHIEVHKVLVLLEEMQRDGIVTSFTNTQRLTIWRLKGAGIS